MRKIILFLTFGIMLCSCAKQEREESPNVVNDRILKAWLNVNNYINPEVTESGVVVLDEVKGTGNVITDSSFVFLNYVCKELDGTIQSSNSESVSKQLGTYSVSGYYGPKVYRIGTNHLSTGIEEALVGRRSGAKLTVVLPSSICAYTSGLDAVVIGGRSVNLVYELEVADVVEYITAYEENALNEYRDRFFPGLDTLSVGYFFVKNTSLPDEDSIANNSAVKVRYIGRMLDGTVFDTNIADSAKFYRMYDASNKYSALEMTYYTNLSEMIENNSTVSGFTRAVYELKKGESCTTFFWSVVGYQDTGNDQIPGYSPLRFDIWVEKE